MFWQAIYWYFNPNWKPVHIFGLIYSVVIISFLVTLPESPKWLYASRRYDQARKSLAIVAKRNNSSYDTNDIVFDSEIALKDGLDALENTPSKKSLT